MTLSVETRGQPSQDFTRAGLDRFSVRHDDSPQTPALRPAPELLRDFALVLAQQKFHRTGDIRLIAGKPHDLEQPAAKTAPIVDVTDQVIDDEGQAVLAIDLQRRVPRDLDKADRRV